MRVVVMGTGYVGLVAGACFSDSGNHVTCLDVDAEKVSSLRAGRIPIFEPGLDEMVSRNTKAGRLTFTTDFEASLKNAEVVFIAVGTPSESDGRANMSYVLKAAETIKNCLKHKAVVVMKSTVPVGTNDTVREVLKGCAFAIDVVSNPEFLKEGTAINDFLRPERVILGFRVEAAKAIMEDLYAPFVRSGNPVLFMSPRSAELAKYAANSFLALKISFINEMGLIAEKVGADINEVRRGIITDSRIGNKFLYPGCGYGGSCFPKDVLALIDLGKSVEVPMGLFDSVHRINERQKKTAFEKLDRHFKGNWKGKTVAIWGLAFKPMTDDMREAPSVTLIEQVLKAGGKVRAYDPVAAREAKRMFENRVEVFDNAYEAVTGADALAVLTEWNEFRSPDFEGIKEKMRTPVLFDGRNLFNPESARRYGFTYFCIGRPDHV